MWNMQVGILCMIFMMEILSLHEGNISFNIQIGKNLTMHPSLQEVATLHARIGRG
jgi:hypothetical protein